MKRSLFATVLFASVTAVSLPATAQVDVHVGINLPPPIVFARPPELVVIPETYVYAVPDIDEDVYFYDGWWWRLWNGRWYRSPSYSSGWVYYQSVPAFYTYIPSGWRNDFRNHRWAGRPWNYQRIPQNQVQQNWRRWEQSHHWENQHTWGVQGLQPRAQWRERPGTSSPQQQRPQARVNPPERGNPQYQGHAPGQSPQARNPQYGGQPQRQARPPEGANPHYQPQPQAQPRPQDTNNPQYHGRQHGQSSGPPPERGNPQRQERPQGQPSPQPAANQPQPQGNPHQGGEGKHQGRPEHEGGGEKPDRK